MVPLELFYRGLVRGDSGTLIATVTSVWPRQTRWVLVISLVKVWAQTEIRT